MKIIFNSCNSELSLIYLHESLEVIHAGKINGGMSFKLYMWLDKSSGQYHIIPYSFKNIPPLILYVKSVKHMGLVSIGLSLLCLSFRFDHNSCVVDLNFDARAWIIYNSLLIILMKPKNTTFFQNYLSNTILI